MEAVREKREEQRKRYKIQVNEGYEFKEGEGDEIQSTSRDMGFTGAGIRPYQTRTNLEKDSDPGWFIDLSIRIQ